MMNQCDGCRAGKPRVKLVKGEWVEAPDAGTHIMGKPGGYPDLQGCTRHLYVKGADARGFPAGTLVTCEHCSFPHPKDDDGRACLFPKLAE